MRRFLSAVFLAAIVAVSVPQSVFAQGADRSYYYDNITVDAEVHPDTTVTITEKQTYNFTGEYHLGYRALSHRKIDGITDIRVIDTETNAAFAYSPTKLDKTNPTSWGKYTTYQDDNGDTVVEWYYNEADTTHTWSIQYTVHGALAFYKDHDELYWNLFTDYDVPVMAAEAFVHLPGPITTPTMTGYVVDGSAVKAELSNDHTFHFIFDQSFMPKEAATIAAGWQKGLVNPASYWSDFWNRNWPFAASGVLLIVSFLFCLLHWFFTEKYRPGHIVVAQYEPAEGLPPAEAELIVKERLSRKTWPATVIDLAVRGHLRIEEDARHWTDYFTTGFGLIFYVVVASIIVFMFSDLANMDAGHGWILAAGVLVVVVSIFVAHLANGLRSHSLIQKHYLLHRGQPGSTSGRPLLPYEAVFLGILFTENSETFSTREVSNSSSQKRVLYMAMQGLEKILLRETDSDTKAYEHSLSLQKKVGGIMVAIGFVAVFLFGYAGERFLTFPHAVLLLSTIMCALAVTYFVKFEARLNPHGNELRDHLLGFKLYLHTAERYRLQNLTPEIFEKYLPYAIIFGVEKQWAKNFDTMNLQSPDWYSGQYAAAGVASGSTSSFSASSFTSSFSASFSSAFASSGASGASGGGGGAGGGGGGGGGGAS